MKWTAAVAAGLLAALVPASAASPPFSVSVETAWAAPPLVLEILETVHDEDPTAYFPLLRLLSKHIPTLSSPTPAAVLEVAQNLIDSHGLLRESGREHASTSAGRTTLDLALALHTAAPRIAAAYAAYDSSRAQALGAADCESWVEVRGRAFCDAKALRVDLERGIEEGKVESSHARIPAQPFDRVSPSLLADGPAAVLYYAPSVAALPLLEYLDEHARSFPTFQYAVRYLPTAANETEAARTPLTGYGVEMALKKTDYLVVDDRNTGDNAQKAFTAKNTAGPFAKQFGDDPWALTATPLTEDEIASLGLKAVSFIKGAEDPLTAFVHLSQDLPKYAASLARNVGIPDEIAQTAARLSIQHPFGPALLINGRVIRDPEQTPFGLLKAIRRERHIISSLMSQDLTASQARSLVADQLVGSAMTEREPIEGLVDASDRPEGGRVISWLNDIETDQQYARWPASAHQYLRPLYPGQMHMVRRNTWNAVLVLDLARPASFDAIVAQVGAMIMRNVPIRIGVVPLFKDKTDDSAKIATAFRHIAAKGKTREFFNVVGALQRASGDTTTINLEHVRNAYERFEKELSFEDLLADSEASADLDALAAYASRVGATDAVGSLLINGHYEVFSNQWAHALQNVLGEQLSYLQEAIHADPTFDDDAISTFFYDLPSTAPRRNAHIVPQHDFETKLHNLVDVFFGEAAVLNKEFIYPPSESAGTPLTIWIAGDLDSADGRALVRAAAEHLLSEAASSRLAFVHVPTPGQRREGRRLSTLLFQLIEAGALPALDPAELIILLDEIESRGNLVDVGKITADSTDDSEAGDAPLNSFTYDGWTAADATRSPEFWRVGALVAERLKMKSAKPHILINGRLIGPVTADDFTAADFVALEQYELRKRVMPVISVLQTFRDDLGTMPRDVLAGLIASTSSIVATAYLPEGTEGVFSQPPGSRSRFYEQMDDGEMSFTVGDEETALVEVAMIIDPITEMAQKWSALAKLATELRDVSVSIHFDPNIKAKEFKVKRFYRSAFRSSMQFDVDGNEVTPVVSFGDLPGPPIFTLAMHTPGSWIVRPSESPLDLDNLLLGGLSGPTHVRFSLKQLVLDGHARDEDNAPPRGLQLQLLRKDGGSDGNAEAVVSDTQVMANLGYLQFKATPGVYDLGIRPGRGQQVFELESTGVAGWDSEGVDVTGTAITLASFDAQVIFPRFRHRPGMEDADVLAVDEVVPSTGGLVGGLVADAVARVRDLLGLSPAHTAPASRHADINIFTVASGLLYERFASIMILSVMKHTQSTVKFWFIENFLSPTFINFLPHLAEQYGFQYELVTYKWPGWLRAQTEKQRIIWAYKILFLDVLFPMDLDKVIFVDADQIVRVDMQELVDLDLHGHVYAYPPMGDDRTEMEGFRFWKTGYWKDELRGRPYHISALYVVDLVKFRQRATGDMLRGNYHALSADPNSLANLDQDLPNSMQRQIPIFTLDKDWLWCQTWCSDESLATAKTIDLCQNPLTKEPKLSRARQIPEWDVYDREIAAFAATLEQGGGALAANVDDLADGPGAVQGKAKAESATEEKNAATPEAESADVDHDEL